jgi:TonB family protein
MKKLLNFCLIGMLFGFSTGLMAQSPVITEDKPMSSVDQMPQYPGGEEALMKFIKNNLHYPKDAVEKGIEGRVTIRLVISSTGEVKDVTVLRGLDPSCDAEALRVIKMMPTWIPGKQSGKAIPVYYTLPIVYKMHEGTGEDKNPLLIVDGNSQPFTLLKDTTLLRPSDIKSISILKDSAATAAYGLKGKNGVIIVETKVGAAKKDSDLNSDKPVYGVEKMPQFPGGENALMEFIGNNLHYPKEAAEVGVQGRVTIRFVVTKTGKVSDITVIRGLNPACDAEAARVIRLMPNWIPGSQEGKPVSVYYTLPIVYKLQK